MKISILQITKNCNQDCFYCTRDRSIQEDILPAIERKINSLSEDTDQIILTGGEPTLREDLYRIIELAKGKARKVHLQSNGINLSDDDLCKQLISSGVSSILIALPSTNKETCEEITQTKDIFEKKIKALQNLSKYKDIELGVVFVVNEKNYKELPEYVNLISSISRDIYIQVTYMNRYSQYLEKIEPFVVKLTKFKPFLDKSLKICEIKNIQFRLDGFPLCFVNEHIKDVSDLRDRKYEFVEDFIDVTRNEYSSNNYPGKEYTKDEGCNLCKLDNSCKGIFEYYAKIFGTSELDCIKDKK